MQQVTLRYGLTKLENINVDDAATYDDVRLQYASMLGLPESVDTFVSGNVVDGDDYVQDGDVITYEKRACAKA